jgi:hypothetical protein
MQQTAVESENMEFDEIAPGIYRGWLCQGRILVMRVTNVSRDSVDAYVEATIEELQNWPQDQIYLALKEMDVAVTPYFHHQCEIIGDFVRGIRIKGRTALVTPEKRAFELVDATVRTDGAVYQMERRVFQDRKSGLAWLRECLT